MNVTRLITTIAFFFLWKAGMGVKQKGLYYQKIPNASKTHNILDTLKLTMDKTGVRECLVGCQTYKTQECKSFNLQVLANETMFKCELIGPSLYQVPYEEEPEENQKDHYKIVWKCFNNGTQLDDSCVCLDGFYGDHCENIIKDCTEATDILQRTGVFFTKYEGAEGITKVNCEGNRWLSVLRHSLPGQPVNHTWAEYRDGYGALGSNEFFIGNELLHKITTARPHLLKITINPPGYWPPTYFYIYETIRVDSENTNYTIHLGEKMSTNCFVGSNEQNLTCADYVNHNDAKATDIMAGLNGMQFSTWDRDNDMIAGNCAQEIGGGFWYNNCTMCLENSTHIISPIPGLEQICTPQNIYKTCELDYCNTLVKISLKVI